MRTQPELEVSRILDKRVLLVAFHFPPIKVSSGLERTLALVRHLPSCGWQPLVLTATESAYPATSSERLHKIPEQTVVRRSYALDASRHFAIRGRYPQILTLPDRWQSWTLSAVPAGLAMIRRYRPQVIWTTYPIASAHVIGYMLHRLSGIPWVADFRDPMVEQNSRTGALSPSWSALRYARLAIESRAARYADALSFCTDGARQICADRYPELDAARWRVIPNGFDESAFAVAERSDRPQRPNRESIVLLHSGTIYPTPDRDPTYFFRALSRVLAQRKIDARPVKVVLRAAGVGTQYLELLTSLQLADHVVFAPSLPYEEALREMLDADGLIIFQGYTSNPAIPAKLYEYLRARRPIFALADKDGETARLIIKESAGEIVPLDDERLIAVGLEKLLLGIENGGIPMMDTERLSQFERARAVSSFAEMFDACVPFRA